MSMTLSGFASLLVNAVVIAAVVGIMLLIPTIFGMGTTVALIFFLVVLVAALVLHAVV